MRSRLLVAIAEAGEMSALKALFLPPDFILFCETASEKVFPRAIAWQPELVILDLGLGLEVLRLLKAEPRTRAIPVFLLCAAQKEEEAVRALSQGAVSYLPRPYSPDELLARARALLRHARVFSGKDAALRCGPVVLDRQGRQVFVNRRALDLAPKEFEILEMLMEAAGRVLTRAQIMERIWGYESAAGPRNVDYQVFQLRKKLGARASAAIDSVSRLGYCFRPEALK